MNVSRPIASQAPLADWAALPLRAIAGYGFFSHGVAKLLKGPDAFVAIVHAMGVPFPWTMAWGTILVELFGGIAVLAGAYIAIASVPMLAILAVAALTVHLPYGFSSVKLMAVTDGVAHFGQPGYETDLLYAACLVSLLLAGPGPWSVDGWRFRRRG